MRSTTQPEERLALEASRYLAVVDAFAQLGVDPHARARTRAARARSGEDHAPVLRPRKGVPGWRR